VFYANYLKFFERGRTEWLRSLELEQQRLKETLKGLFVVSETRVRYHRPCRLDDRLTVATRLVKTSRATLDLHQWVALHDQPTVVLCDADIRVAWVHAETFKPMRLPPTLTNVLPKP
jgi:acyl-CoA thioester hydrolase